MTPGTLIALVGAFALQALRAPMVKPIASNPLPVVHSILDHAPHRKEGASLGVEVTAKAAIVMDMDTGAVLFEKNADQALPIASLTKLVTAMTYLDTKPDLSKEVTILPEDMGAIGGSELKAGDTLPAGDVFQAMLVGSLNESADALARSAMGREAFVAAMNQKALELGMTGAHFVDPSGLDSLNHASARDVAIALKAASAYPEIRDAMAKSSLTLTSKINAKPYVIKSTNLLLTSDINKSPYKIVAAKSGTLPEAGYCFAQITQGPDGHRIIALVLNDDSHFGRFQDVKALTYWAFRSFEWPHEDRS
ncbi:MAG TPA: serine hydrolase [Verrucomicrobiae bacterium]|nr:serine hydrolase [Verrucomicrobiae bacterium]